MKHVNPEGRPGKRRCIAVLIPILIMMVLAGCDTSAAPEPRGTGDTVLPSAMPSPGKEESGETEKMVYAHVNGRTLAILLEDNTSAEAFMELLKSEDVTVYMHDYGNFEKVGPIGRELPRNDMQITTEPGDVILYQGNQITIYYDVNSWSFTRIGKIQGLSGSELKEILGDGDAAVTFSRSNSIK